VKGGRQQRRIHQLAAQENFGDSNCLCSNFTHLGSGKKHRESRFGVNTREERFSSLRLCRQMTKGQHRHRERKKSIVHNTPSSRKKMVVCPHPMKHRIKEQADVSYRWGSHRSCLGHGGEMKKREKRIIVRIRHAQKRLIPKGNRPHQNEGSRRGKSPSTRCISAGNWGTGGQNNNNRSSGWGEGKVKWRTPYLMGEKRFLGCSRVTTRRA